MLCDSNSPLNEVKDALTQFLGYVVKVENMAAEAKKAEGSTEEQKTPEAKDEQASSNN